MKITVEVEVPDGEKCKDCLFLDDQYVFDGVSKRPVSCYLFQNEHGLDTEKLTIKKFPSCLAACQKATEQQTEIAKTGLTIEQILNDQIELILLKSVVKNITDERHPAVNELSALKEANQWIPVSERLPEIESTEVWEMYLCKLNRYGEIKIAALWFLGGSWYSDYSIGSHYDDFVIAWRPLPKVSESEE